MAGLEIDTGSIKLKNDLDEVIFDTGSRSPHIVGSIEGTMSSPTVNVTIQPVVDWFSNFIFSNNGGVANDTPAFNIGLSGGTIQRQEFVLDNNFQYLTDNEIILIPYFKVNGNYEYSSHPFSQAGMYSPSGYDKWHNGQGGFITQEYQGDLSTCQLSSRLGNSTMYAKIIYDGQYKLVVDHVTLLSGFSGIIGGYIGGGDFSAINTGILGSEPNNYTPTTAGLDVFFGIPNGLSQNWENERCLTYYNPAVRANASSINRDFTPSFTVDFKIYIGMYF